MEENDAEYASKLREIIENPNSFQVDVDYNKMREVLSEIYTQTSECRKAAAQFEQMQTQFLKPSDLKSVNEEILKISSRVDQQASEFSTELREIRAFFTFQMKDLNSKIDNGMASVITELSKPVSPIQSPIIENGQISIQDSSLRSDFEVLRERFDALLESIQNNAFNKYEEEEEEEEEVKEKEEEEKAEEDLKEENNEEPIEEEQKPEPVISEPEPKEKEVEEKVIEKSIPTPIIEPETPKNKGLTPEKPKKERLHKKFVDPSIVDMKIQLKKAIERINELSTSYNKVDQMETQLGFLEGEQAKVRSDTIILKSELQRLSSAKDDKIAEAMKEINISTPVSVNTKDMVNQGQLEKSLKVLRVEYVQQIAAMHNVMDEELKKLRTEMSSMKAKQSEFIDNVHEEMAKMDEEIKAKEVPIVTEEIKEEEEEEESVKSPIQEVEEEIEEMIPKKVACETQTDNVSDQYHSVTTTQTINMPNQLITTVIANNEPVKKEAEVVQSVEKKEEPVVVEKKIEKPVVVEKKIEEPVVVEKKKEEPAEEKSNVQFIDINKYEPKGELKIRETESFHIEMTASSDDIDNMQQAIEKQQEMISDLYEQTGQFDSRFQEFKPYCHEIVEEAIKSKMSGVDLLISDINSQVGTIQNNVGVNSSNITTLKDVVSDINGKMNALEGSIDSKLDKSQLPVLKAAIKKVADSKATESKVVLTPVNFSSLYVAPMPVFSIKQQSSTVVKKKEPIKKKPPVKKEEKPKPSKEVKPKPVKVEQKKKEVPKKEEKAAPKPEKVEEKKKEVVVVKKVEEQPKPKEIPTKQQVKEEIEEEEEEYMEEEIMPEIIDVPLIPIGNTVSKEENPQQNTSHSVHSVHSSGKKSAHSIHSVHSSGKKSAQSVHSERTKSAHSVQSVHSEKNKSVRSKKSTQRSEREEEEVLSQVSQIEEEEEMLSQKSLPLVQQIEEDDDEPVKEIVDDIPVKEVTESTVSTLHPSPNDSEESFEEEEEDFNFSARMSTTRSQDNERINQIVHDIDEQREQTRLLRNALVELRSYVRELSTKATFNESIPAIIPQPEIVQQTQPIHDETSDKSIRSLRKRTDMQNKAVNGEILAIKQDIFEIKKHVNELKEYINSKDQSVSERPRAQQPLLIKPIAIDKGHDQSAPQRIQANEAKPSMMKITPLKLPALSLDDSPKSSIRKIDAPSAIQASEEDKNEKPKQQEIKAKAPLPSIDNNVKANAPQKSFMNDQKDTQNTNLYLSEPLASSQGHNRVFTNIVPQKVEEISIINAPDSIDKDVLQLILDVRTQLQLQIGQSIERLNAIEERTDTFVEKEFVSKFFSKMRVIINETNTSVDQMKQSYPDKVTKEELHKAMEDLYAALTHDESTSGGTTSMRCLLCGRPKTQISGMITDRSVAEALGDPTQGLAAGGKILYGPDKQMYKGRGKFWRTTASKIEEKKLPNL